MRAAPIGSPSARVSGSARAATPVRAAPAGIGPRRSSQSVSREKEASGRLSMYAWPARGTSASSASGIRDASSRAFEIGAIPSCSPCMTSVGASIEPSREIVSW